MRLILGLCLALLAAYSIAVATVEVRLGPEVVRTYLQDPASPQRFAHVNTTLSTALLWGTALLFAVALRARSQCGTIPRREKAFLVSQFLLFLYLGCDERFRLDVALSGLTGLNDAAILLGMGALEIGLLLGLGRILRAEPAEMGLLLLAGTCAGLSYLTDNFLPARSTLHHSAEDLSKVWAGALLLAWAWRRVAAALEEIELFPQPGAAWELGLRAGGQSKGHPAVRQGAPEPSPQLEADNPSAAPPRKLLSR